MPRYSDEFKEQVVRKMMLPNAQSVAQVYRETGISEPTLYAWRNRFRAEGQVVPADPSNPENWSGNNKLAVVIETAVADHIERQDRREPALRRVDAWGLRTAHTELYAEFFRAFTAIASQIPLIQAHLRSYVSHHEQENS